MKCLLWAVSAAIMVFFGGQSISLLAQDNNDDTAVAGALAVPADAPVAAQEDVAPADTDVPVDAPADTPAEISQPTEPQPEAVGLPPVVPVPADAPVAAQEDVAPADTDAPVDAPAEISQPEAVLPSEDVKPSEVPPADAVPEDAVSEVIPAVAKTPGDAAVPAEPDKFELDRASPSKTAVPGIAPSKEFAPAGEKPPEKKASFWNRMFGRGKDKDRTKTPALSADKPEAAGAPPRLMRGKPVPSTVEGLAPSATRREEMLAAQEEVRRQAREIEGLKHLDLAYRAMSRNEFEEALKLFNQALSIMPRRPHTVETRNKARMAQAQCEYRLALNCYQQGNQEEVKKAVHRALGYVPLHKESLRLKERIARDEIRKRTAKPPPIRFAQKFLDKEERINAAISRGRQYMAIRDYKQAAYEFKTVIIEDKGNEEANANLKKIAEKGYKLETDQYKRMQVEMIAQVRDTWTPPIKPEVVSPLKTHEGIEMIQPEKQRLLKKLNTIVIPQLDFRQANIVDVIRYLDQQTIIADKDSPAGEKGVNIILNLKRPGQVGGVTPVAGETVDMEKDIFSTEGEASATLGTSSSIPTVTLTLRNIVLLDAIKFITEVTGLKFRVESNVVVITPADVVVGEVMTRTYRVQPNMGDIIGGAVSASAPGGVEGGGIDMGLTLGATATVDRGGDVKRFFIEAGVPFPEGTSIKYQPSLNLIIVANTGENLEKFEQILAKLNVIPIQVEIEARFVEVAQTDLEELGVEWLLTDNWEIAQDAAAGAAVPLSARERVQINQNQLTKGLRSFDDAAGALSTIPGGAMAGIFSVSSILTNPELSFILHALEQRAGANLLSAPKVTTKTGANAEIKVVRELIYPTEFEQETQTAGTTTGINNNQLTQIVVTPAGFQTRDLGVILNVTPVVGPDGYTIDLTMMPQVVELVEWIDYGSTVLDPGGVLRKVPMPQPVFHSRSIATSISIWDGQTVVMGGLITEQQETTVDKIPFLGDIPLIGYLFRSKTSKSVKRNLLIFVTANLVDPAGNKINKAPVGLVSSSPVMP